MQVQFVLPAVGGAVHLTSIQKGMEVQGYFFPLKPP